MKRYRSIDYGRVTAIAGDPLIGSEPTTAEPKKPAFIVFFQNKNSGYFLRGEGDDIRDYGGTHVPAEAARFKTARQARELGEAYLRMCRSDPERSSVTVLKQV
ncbi:hypothetical protein [Burkholderia pseudomultivorans]|uniref:hypothetical protein n=1 Tax=Burkholderia pseudomultivorans TaxID=1207504 RepID=UPI00084227BA|nr:hypothetical protein [Burkholderia pseudomultivorans]AOI92084.1 hypothetical protein WS57_25570 [Burkholderia pseudomultivorans]